MGQVKPAALTILASGRLLLKHFFMHHFGPVPIKEKETTRCMIKVMHPDAY